VAQTLSSKQGIGENNTDCVEVELIVNGQSLGKMKPDKIKIARWSNVALQQGQNRVEAVADSMNQKFADSCEWVLEATRGNQYDFPLMA
jgi:Domain of unknown function (DUF4982)